MTSIELIVKKLDGLLTDQEEVDFELWLQESEENQAFFQKMEWLRNEGREYHFYKKIDVDDAWQQVLQKRKKVETIHLSAPAHVGHSLFLQYRFQVAAAMVLLIISAGILSYFHFYGTVRLQTAYGQKKAIILPDQSEVVLNANSRLWYKKDEPRKVWLEGEAFFDVQKKPATQEKFQVITSDLKVEVLGTAFNVNSRNEQTKVFLEEGSVKLDLKDDSLSEVFLVPGEMLTYSTQKRHPFEKTRLHTNLTSSWKEGIHLFEKAPLHEVLDKMEDIYGVSIELKEKNLADLELTMGIPIEDLHIALETIESMLGLKISRNSDNSYMLE